MLQAGAAARLSRLHPGHKGSIPERHGGLVPSSLKDSVASRSIVLASCACRDRSSHTGRLKATETHFLTLLEARCLKSRCRLGRAPSGGSREESFLPFPAAGGELPTENIYFILFYFVTILVLLKEVYCNVFQGEI